MRVDDRGVGEVEAVVEVRHALVEDARQAVGAVDVEPDAELVRDLAQRADRVDRAGVRRARGGDDGHREHAVGEVALDRLAQPVGTHPPALVGLDEPHVGPADPQHPGARCTVWWVSAEA